MRRHRGGFAVLCLFAGLCFGEPLRVAVLHPMLEEWVARLAGDAVEVACTFPDGGNLHRYEPTPGDLARLREMDLIVAMGKHLEPYLDRLRENLPSEVAFFEIGRRVPSVRINPELAVFACCPAHAHGAIDPHWWHSPLAARRAVRGLGGELEARLPEHRDGIRQRTREMMDELKALHVWTTSQVAAIPKSQRKLVTAHAAFGYFCTEYQFQAIPVKGLENEGQPTPSFLGDTIRTLKRENVRAVFPERSAGNAALRAIRDETGIEIGRPLIADFVPRGEGETYESMFRANVANMVAHLGDVSP